MQFPGAVRSFPHPCGGRTVPKNREEVRKRFAYQPNGVPCGVFLHTFLHRLWKSFALLCGKWERECGLAPPRLLASPLLSPAGAWRFWSPVDFAAVVPEGVACLLCRLPTTPLACFPAPYSPDPLPRRGRGRPRLFHARGFAPCIPGVEPGRHRSRGRTTHPAGVCLRNRQLAAKPIEQPFYWQCRQPRRGGTGGDGTIRRTRRRRLRWSSPPGQAEQMPHGERSPAPPSGGTGAGAYRALAGACLLCRLPPLPLACFSAPYPPARARRALFPSGEGGDFLFSYARGFAPCIPGIEPGAALAIPAPGERTISNAAVACDG